MSSIELMKVCSSRDPDNPRFIRTLTADDVEVQPGTRSADGSLERPWIVWFGEAVPNLGIAADAVAEADAFAIIGSSLNVYPAAGLVRYVRPEVPVFVIDPKAVRVPTTRHFEMISDVASRGVDTLAERLAALWA